MSQDEYCDDSSIPDDAVLWRRIPPSQVHFDTNQKEIRPASSSFTDSRDGSPMSVFLADAMLKPEHALVGHGDYSLVAFTAGFARSKKQIVVRDPLPNEPAHALVVGKKSRRTKKDFAKEARWVVGPPPHILKEARYKAKQQ